MIRRAPRPESHFTQLRNDVLRDRRLSFRARGILTFILSHPDDWRITSASLSQEGKEGRDAIRSALRELREAGYLIQGSYRDAKGQWAHEQVVYDMPPEARGHDGRLRPEDLG